MRIALVLFVVLTAACEKAPPEPTATTVDAGPKATRAGSELLKGTWQVEGFEAAPGGASSAAALQAQADSAEAQAVRITYTDKQVQIQAPGQPVLSSSYEVLDSRLGFVKIMNGKDQVMITFRDDDHMIIDRQGNQFGAKMKMKRASGPAPAALASGPVQSPFGSAKVVGTNAAGHQIVKIGGP